MSAETTVSGPPSSAAATASRSFQFGRYQIFVVALLAVLQFTVVLDLMVLAPLGPFLMPSLHIVPHQFGLVVSAYAFAAGASGLLAAGFADRFDRKRMLLVFYTGFLAGTFLCGVADTFPFLLVARVVTGFFGGVIAAISNAIVADLFPVEVRGRVMGAIQSAFSVAQVLGLPAGLILAEQFGWHGPFLTIAFAGIAVGVAILVWLKPVDAHMRSARRPNPVRHLLKTASTPRYLMGFSATMLVALGAFMLQPFASTFLVYNLKIPEAQLSIVYVCMGACGFLGGFVLGWISDVIGKFKLFAIASLVGTIWVVWYTHLHVAPMWLAIAANAFFALVIVARMSSNMAIISSVPAPADRGAYMAISASVQQLAGGVASWVAGLIVWEGPTGALENYHWLGWVVGVAMLVTLLQMANLNRKLAKPA